MTCNGTTYVTTSHPTLRGKDHDNNRPALQVKVRLRRVPARHQHPQGHPPGAKRCRIRHRLRQRLREPARRAYDYVARAANVTTDGTAVQSASAASGRVSFTVDTTAPAGTPTASSWDFPASYWGAPAGKGSIHLDDGAATNAVGFVYAFDSASNLPTLPNLADSHNQPLGNGYVVPDVGGGADISTPSTLSEGPHTLYFRTFDAAHRASAGIGQYSIYVSPVIGGEGNPAPRRNPWPHRRRVSPQAFSRHAAENCEERRGSSTSYDEAFPVSGGHDWHLLATCGDPTYGPTYTFPLPAITVSADYASGWASSRPTTSASTKPA